MPQLIENYQLQSADGISLGFLTIWFIGDIANLSGAIWAGLVPTVIALAVYFCFADAILITQCLYYKFLKVRRDDSKSSLISGQSEIEGAEQPLLRRNSDNIGLPGSRRRSSASQKRRTSSLGDPLPAILEVEIVRSAWLKNATSVFLTCLAGSVGWVIAWKTGVWIPTPAEVDNGTVHRAFGAEALGYVSAVLYLGYVMIEQQLHHIPADSLRP